MDNKEIGSLNPQQRRFGARTILIPLLFMAVHWLAINISALIYMIAYLLLSGDALLLDPGSLLGDSEFLNKILVEKFPIITVIYSSALIPVYLVFLHISRQRDKRSMLLESTRMDHLIPALAMMVGALGLTNLWFSLLQYLAGFNGTINRLLEDYIKQAEAFAPDAGYFWLILGITIMAPIAEELLFRGIIQGELRKAMPEWLAIVLQAIIFALFHMQPVQITYVLVPGLLLGIAYAWSRTLWVPVLMHILFNFLGSVLPALADGDEVLGAIIFYSEIAFIAVGILAGWYFFFNRRRAEAQIRVETQI